MAWSLKSAFNSGELSPLLRARFDFEKYGLGCAYAENFLFLPQGGISNRPGTLLVGEAAGPCRLVPFNYSRTDSYVLVFTEGRMEVVKGDSFVMDGESHYGIASPYAFSALEQLRFSAQTGATMILTHPDYPPQVLTRIADDSWTLETLALKPAVEPPSEVTASYSGGASPSPAREYKYIVTASVQNKGESFPSNSVSVSVENPWPAGETVSVSWTPVYGADAYHVYKDSNGSYGWIGSVSARNEISDAANMSRAVSVLKTSDGSAFDGNPLSPYHKWSVGNSLGFSADRYVSLPSSADYAMHGGVADSWTIDFWISFAAGSPAVQQTVAEAEGSWRLWLDAAKRLHFKTLPSGSEMVSSIPVPALPPSQFHYVAVRHVSSSAYITFGQNDGAGNYTYSTIGSMTLAGALPASGRLAIGARTDRSLPFTGEIDEFRLRTINYVDVPTEVATLDADTKVLLHFDGAYLIDDAISPSADEVPVENRDPFASEDGYPAASAFFDQRLMLARTAESPQTVWGSRTGDPFNFGTTMLLKDDDAVTIPIASRQLAEIRHLVPLDTLLAFTSSSYFAIGGAGNGALTPSDIVVRPKGDSPVSPFIAPLVIGTMVVFCNPDGKLVNGLFVAADSGVYQEQELSILGEHLPSKNPIKEWAYQRFPTSTVWCVCDNGTGLLFTIHREHQVYAWGRWSTADGDTLESVASIASEDQDMVYVCAKRDDQYLVERVARRLPDSDVTLGVFLDSAVVSTGQTISGLDHLEGRTVGVLADGQALAEQTVTGGEVDLGRSYTTVVVGLPYDCEARSLPLNLSQTAKGPAGPTRVPKLAVQVTESVGGVFFACEDRLPAYSSTREVTLSLRTDEGYDNPQLLATGMFELSMFGQWQSNQCIGIRQPLPLPLTVNAIATDTV